MINSIDALLKKAFVASKTLQHFPDAAISDLLLRIANEIEAEETSILKANQKDLKKMTASDPRVWRNRQPQRS